MTLLLTSVVTDETLAAIADHVAAAIRAEFEAKDDSPYLSVNEAALFLRCKRQRIYDLLSIGRLSRVKEAGRTLVLRSEVEALVTVEREAVDNRGGA